MGGSRALTGLAVGMALAFAGWFGGFGAFLLVAALGAVGWVVGRWSEGGLDREGLSDLVAGRSRR